MQQSASALRRPCLGATEIGCWARAVGRADVQRHGELEMQEDLAFERREWVAEPDLVGVSSAHGCRLG